MQQLMKSVSCPEHIMICLDVSNEMNTPTFRNKVGERLSSLKVAKKALQMFISNKSRLDKRHRFSLAFLHDEIDLVHDFTDDAGRLCDTLEKLDRTCAIDSEIDLTTVIKFMNANVKLCDPHAPSNERYVVRLILVYGRTHCLPQISSVETLKRAFDNPYFFVDVLYLHEPEDYPEIRQKCTDTFTLLAAFDIRKDSYIHEVSKNPVRAYNYAAIMLAHPLQRVTLQQDFRISSMFDGAGRGERHNAMASAANNGSNVQTPSQTSSRSAQSVSLSSVSFV